MASSTCNDFRCRVEFAGRSDGMKHRDAVALLEGAVPRRPGTWADLGSGDGTFTRAIAELVGPGSRVYAVDRDASALASVMRQKVGAGVEVIPVTADFTGPFELPGFEGQLLDGILLANALHFGSDPGPVLRRLAERVRPGGRVIVVEYDNRAASRWVPYPIPSAQWPVLAGRAGLTAPVVAGSRRSAFGGALYVGVAGPPEAKPPRRSDVDNARGQK
jgi:SAM-dependent methyltransferase